MIDFDVQAFEHFGEQSVFNLTPIERKHLHRDFLKNKGRLLMGSSSEVSTIPMGIRASTLKSLKTRSKKQCNEGERRIKPRSHKHEGN